MATQSRLDTMRNYARENSEQIEWGLGIFVTLVALLVWWMTRISAERGVTIYDLFPLFGLIAFSLMLTHFVMGAKRRYLGVTKKRNDAYMNISMGIVFSMLILHPGLLWFALWQDGLGLPPQSYLQAYSTQILAVSLGSISLSIFLAFELKRWYGERKWWRYVALAQYVGMAAIFFHALSLGRELSVGWYMALWYFYGFSLLLVTLYNLQHWRRAKTRAILNR